MSMQDWSHPGSGRATGPEAERDPADTVPDRPEPAGASDDESSEWDELTPVATARLTPPTDVLVAGTPLADPARQPAGGQPTGSQPTGSQLSGSQLSGSQAPTGQAPTGQPSPVQPSTGRRPGQMSAGQLTDRPAGDAFGTTSAEPAASGSGPSPGFGPGARSGEAAEPSHRGGATVLDSGAADGFHSLWREVQYSFVDDPDGAVRHADDLADEVLNAFTDALTAHKQALTERWQSQQAAPQDTERLRLIVRAYREFVDRLLTT